ncbi:MAG: phosphatidate cytidylyltransferase [Puniceicoccales bacterium]|nr:phosphatidate cytidylyltransferase [Puniceicoccales bacterium]
MTARIFSTVTLWLSLGLVLYFGKIWGGLALLLLVSSAAHWELGTLLSRCGTNPRREFGVVLGMSSIVGLCWIILLKEPPQNPHHFINLAAVLPGMVIAVIAFLLLRDPAKLIALFGCSPTAISWLYIPCGMMPLASLATEFWAFNKGDLSGLFLVLWFTATVKFADCGALLGGLLFGKHKLAPSISPGKTWEGCVGGILMSIAVAAGTAWILGHWAVQLGWTVTGLTPGRAALVAIPLAVLSIPSDLVESVFKRRAGVKDSGRTIPGIGGAFDLIDSLVLTAPFAYLLIKFYVL